ncbi:copper resistance CopC/CopD family protein [Brochothrix thermosphacta]|uniref:copper resistance CopC/CopD family protein n=1 Tax=Brochothrix thermosphacta TaxID=2756 RepID=UPI003F96466D
MLQAHKKIGVVGVFLIVVMTIILGFTSMQTKVSAHAYVQQTTPGIQENVKQAPKQVVVQFDEAIQNQSPLIIVTNQKGEQISDGNASIEKENSHVVSVPLKKGIKEGIYTVNWRVISADGHAISGTFMFGFNSSGEIPSASSDESKTPVLQSLVKWPLYTGFSLISGVLLGLFYLIPRTSRRHLFHNLKLLTMIGILLIVIASITQFIAQTALLNNVSVVKALDFRLAWKTLISTEFGIIWLIRTVSLFMFAVIGHFYFNRSSDKWHLKLGVMTLLFIIMGLATSFMGHTQAYTTIILSTLTDWIHLTAAGIWLGGVMLLLSLYLAHRSKKSDEVVNVAYSTSLERFAAVGFIAVLVLIMSGVLLSAFYLSSLMQIFKSTYGQTLLIKGLLIFIMGVLGIFHFVSRTMKNKKVPNRGTLWAEIIAGLLILGVVGFLTNTATPPPPDPKPISSSVVVGDHTIDLEVLPAVIGQNTFRVRMDRETKEGNWQQIKMIVEKDRSEVSTTTTMSWNKDAQSYEAQGLFISQVGRWKITIKALSEDFKTVEETFIIRIER